MFKDQIQPDEHTAYGLADLTSVLQKLANPEGELRSYEDCKKDFGRVLVPNSKYPDLGKGVVFEDDKGNMVEYHPYVPLFITGIPDRLKPE